MWSAGLHHLLEPLLVCRAPSGSSGRVCIADHPKLIKGRNLYIKNIENNENIKNIRFTNGRTENFMIYLFLFKSYNIYDSENNHRSII